jgi:hypothetical protein
MSPESDIETHAGFSGVVRASITLARIRWMLTRRGFNETINQLRSLRSTNPAPSDERTTVEHIVAQVAVAGALFPGRARCLEQALALHSLLRRRGIPTTVYLGVRPHRFQAHAWVEYRGQPLNEGTDMIRRVTAVPVLNS